MFLFQQKQKEKKLLLFFGELIQGTYKKRERHKATTASTIIIRERENGKLTNEREKRNQLKLRV